ncbi:MAG: ArsA family ATPase [Planctomycetes bacterium]|nr:ArsA family ATPase [Planctomycetota bacterium]
MSYADLETLLREKKIILCCGSGGVGKTTTSASLAMAAAFLGRKAVVCTIDPARRLANSLGLEELDSEVVRVDPARFAAAGVEVPGEMYALMLDTKGTFDRLIGRYAKTEEARTKILANRFYQQMSGTVVGSSDFMAMEKLYELFESGEFDLIVLDTPPTKHAIDFLEAPKRMTEAFDESTLEIFLKPWAETSKRSFGFLGRALNRVIRKVDSVLGLKFVEDLAEFFRAFEGMYEGFRGRAQRVDLLLREEFTAFLVVTSPQPLPLSEASYFCDRLREFKLPLEAVIVNRVNQSSLTGAPADALAERLEKEGARALLDEALSVGGGELEPTLRAFIDQELLAAGDRTRIAKLRIGAAKDSLVHEIPRFNRDVHDLAGLKLVVDHLLGSPGGTATPEDDSPSPESPAGPGEDA